VPAQLRSGQSRRKLEISVIIPTYNRRDSLLETLDSLSRQTLAASRFEVMVVDDGSTDATSGITSLSYPFDLGYLPQTNQGAAAARNHGARVSRGQVLVFIDDDITLESGYLRAILKAHHSRRKLISMGTFRPYLSGQDSAFAILHARQVAAKAAEQDGLDVSFTDCSSNNCAVERQDFFDIGMWRDVFGDGPTLWGDVEFGYRAWKQGFSFSRIGGAKLYHRDRHVMNLESACKRAYHISRMVHFLFQQHPEIAQHMCTFQDKHPIAFFSDPPHLVIQKLFHIATSCPAGLWVLKSLAHTMEAKAPESRPLELLYRWIVSAYIFKGYRQGLRELAK
jgi:glycosyltransferase involved in cell wall biosynthesis